MSSLSQASLLHRHKGTLFSAMSSKELLDSLDSFDAREDDIFLVSYPKSGEFFLKCTYCKMQKCSKTNRTIVSIASLFIRSFIPKWGDMLFRNLNFFNLKNSAKIIEALQSFPFHSIYEDT